MLKAITRRARLVDAKVAAHNKTLRPGATPLTIAGFFDHHATEADTEVMVSEEDFDSARRELVPSVSYEELQHYEGVRRTFEGNGEAGKKEGQAKIAITPEEGHEVGDAKSAHKRGMSMGKIKGLREKTLNSLHRKSVKPVEEVEDEDEYVIGLNGHGANGNGTGNGKAGKGKAKANGNGFGDAAVDDDEELYS